MKLVLLGAPGAGKGTQALKIAEKYKVLHISTGDLLRKNIKERTEIGKKAKEYVDTGRLVPDDVVIAIVKDAVKASPSFLLDGFPRTIEQAVAVDSFTEIGRVINLIVDEAALLTRITGRRGCKACAAIYNTAAIGDIEKCPACGGLLFQRADDNEETVKARLEVYKKQTAPLVEYYEKQGKLVSVKTDRTPEEAFADIEKILGRL